MTNNNNIISLADALKARNNPKMLSKLKTIGRIHMLMVHKDCPELGYVESKPNAKRPVTVDIWVEATPVCMETPHLVKIGNGRVRDTSLASLRIITERVRRDALVVAVAQSNTVLEERLLRRKLVNLHRILASGIRNDNVLSKINRITSRLTEINEGKSNE
ncbi:hypothetical protein GR7B_00007 [Vibrio phage vB_VcorM_GR7B]|nr:hypothetical protein GR7B_00007 [Vibrio phage vB_VcorM_GR7B]